MAYPTQARAKTAATALLDQLGANWSTRVWSNLGWPAEAYRAVENQEVQVWAVDKGYCALAGRLCLSYTAATPLDAVAGLREKIRVAAEEAFRQHNLLVAMVEKL